jgi:hypothetical protein
MEWDVDTLIDNKVMMVKNFGNMNIDQINRLTRDVIVTAKKSQLDKILVDHTEMTLVASVINIYEYVKEMNNSLRRNAKIAVLISESISSIEDYRFYETACLNNGFFVRVFTSKEDALFWLASFS